MFKKNTKTLKRASSFQHVPIEALKRGDV